MTAPVLPSFDVPVEPPPTNPWRARPPGGWIPPTDLGGWDSNNGQPDLPPVVALLYRFHLRQLQAAYGDREPTPLENAIMDDLQRLQQLDSAELLQLDLRLALHMDYVAKMQEFEKRGYVPPELRDDETEQHLAYLDRISERMLWLGLELRGFISSRIVVQ